MLNLEKTNWTIEFSWVKVHVGIYGNEIADPIAKDAACSTEIPIDFDRIPKTTLYSKFEDEATQKWQNEREQFSKAAVTKQFFFLQNVRDRIHLRKNIN